MQRSAQDVDGHGPQFLERPIAMAADSEINLGEAAHAELARDIDQQCNLDPVGRLQGDRCERVAAPSGLAGEWLADLAETGVEPVSYTHLDVYKRQGWNTAAGGEGISYDAGGMFTVTTSLSLYAQWTETNYVVNFHPDGGTVSPASTSFSSSTSTVELPTPADSGYTFSGWFTAASGGTLVGLGGSSTALTASTDLYAQWVETNYVVNFHPDGGSVNPATASFNIDSRTVELPTPTYSGYTFSGWFTAASGGTLVLSLIHI